LTDLLPTVESSENLERIEELLDEYERRRDEIREEIGEKISDIVPDELLESSCQ